ncbi:MAG: hypothetical protein KGL74_10585, partial [Elusimicrobia bacterium]|nr:hypothetical protein [Elusimicrobiota bacterium]
MKKSISYALTTFAATALLLSAAVMPALSAETAEWYSPAASIMAPGALKPSTPAGPSAATASPALVGHARMLLMKGIQLKNGAKKAPIGTSATPALQYYGGPMLSNVKIQLVYWNKDVANQDKLPGFFSAITNGSYFD